MRTVRLGGLLLPAVFALLLAAPQHVAAQAKSSGNLFKDITERKDINWRNAPATLPPADVCSLLQSCGAPSKIFVQTPVTEGGKKITRAVFLTKSADAKHSDQIILDRQTATEVYYFLLTPDGNLAKTAYGETGKSWQQLGSIGAQPTFDVEKKAWQGWVAKLGAAPPPAAAPAAESKP